jgi:putative SOS response-associated peptidase YedK
VCGRFVLATPVEMLAEIFEAELAASVAAEPLAPSWNVAPTRPVHVVRRGSAGREIAVARWGLVPSWAPDMRRAAHAINARLETLHEKPTFRHLLASHRCVVPMTGYYEWSTTGVAKQPWYVHRADGAPIAAAGLWSRWHDGLETCAVITREAGPRLAEIHHRMPVVLERGDLAEWLEAPALPRRACDSASDAALAMRRVSTRVNSVRHDDASLVDAAEPETLFG